MTPVEAIFRYGHTLQHIAVRRNGCLLFLLIVFILGFDCAWKTSAVLWITQIGCMWRCCCISYQHERAS